MTNNTDRLWITSGGNVGIGITNPSTLLEVAGVIRGASLNVYGSTDPASTSPYLYSPSTGALGIGANGSERMRITSAGSVGIGTSTPTQGKLVVSGSVANSIMNVAASINAGNNALNIGDDGTNAVLGVANSSTDMLFLKRVAGVYSEAMRITSAGSVGIGTSSPNSILQIKGAFNIERSSTTDYSIIDNEGNLNLKAATGGGGGSFNTVFFTGGSERMRITSGGYVSFNGNTANINPPYLQGISVGWNKSNGQGESIINWTNAGGGTSPDLTFNYWNNTTFSERMRITSGGEVYIAGTTDQGAYNLQVNGTGVWGAGAYVNGSDSALKQNIQPLDNSLDLVKQMKPVTYTYKESYSKDSSVQTGFIAQDLQILLKDKNYLNGIVKDGTYLSVAYQNLIPLLVKAIQEQQIEIEKLKNK